MKFIRKCLFILVLASLMVAGSGFLLRTRQETLSKDKVEAATGVSYTVDNIPRSNKRPMIKRQIKYIVIHNTANESSTAQNERDYLVNPNNTSSTSFHLAVDENEIVEAVPVNEVAFHAGNGEGNRNGIGIEICESGNFKQTRANAARLTAYLMKTYNLSLEQVKTHQDFSGKYCPRKMLGSWEDFLAQVEHYYSQLE